MLLGREQRRLAAIVSADVAGYSRLMGRDESGTLAALKALRRDVVDPPISAHGGRIVKTTGDGLLLEFPSVVDAVRCVIEVQTAVAAKTAGIPEDRRIAFRVGINLGDIIIDGDDIFGDGVNIAARLEALSEPGGACLSDDAFRQVRGKIDASFVEIGAQTLKNIAQPVHAWCWMRSGMSVALAPALALPEKPSIAVLPFQNMSGDPDQEYFADGMTEDILTALSRFQNLFVISRNSSFTYKGRSVDIKQVGKELGVRYALEGSVRSAANRVRITAQLIDATSGNHVWADRYDRALTDIFAVQDEVTAQIVAAIDFEVRAVEAQRPSGSASAGLEAWARYHKAFPLLFRLTEEENRRAADLFDELRTSHPNLAVAHAGYGFARSSEVIYGWAADGAASARAAVAPCRKAVELDDKDAFCHFALGRALLLAGDRDLALATIERAVARNPNSALAHLFKGVTLAGLDRDSEALAEIDLAIRLSPRDPGLWSFYFWQSRCQRALGHLDTAIRSLRQAIGERPDLWFLHLDLATTLAKADRIEEAKAAVTKARELRSDLSLDGVAYLDSLFMSSQRAEENQRFAATLGVPKAIAKVGASEGSLDLPDKPSIAVLPFQNMSGDPEQEYFADGISEDIITELTRFRLLFVIARNSSFSYKGTSPDVRDVGRELGVRYVLEGSVRKAGDRIRLTGQLIDTRTGSHIWAERYDRRLNDVFAVQEELTRSIVRAIAPHITESELARVNRRRLESLSAYELGVRASATAWDAFARSDPKMCDEALRLADAALTIDPDSVTALGARALAQFQHIQRGTAVDRQTAWRDGMEAAKRLVQLDRSYSNGHVWRGMYLVAAPQGERRYDDAVASARRGVDLNPHDMATLIGAAFVETLSGNFEQSTELAREALRVSPRDPMRPHILQQLVMATFHLGRYVDAIEQARQAIVESPGLPALHAFLAASLAALGQYEEAKAAFLVAQKAGPEYVARLVSGNVTGRDTAGSNRRITTFLRIAGGLEDPSAAKSLR
jgi:adenylate cyclase